MQSDMALGDWQNKGDQPDVEQMAIRYSSAKYAAFIRQTSSRGRRSHKKSWTRPKHMGWPKLNVCCARTGNLFGPLRRSSSMSGNASAVRGLCREGLKGSRGYTMTATVKNGKPLCPHFHTDECPNPSESCHLEHIFALSFNNLAGCGGKHGTGVCRNKRAVMAATPVPVAPKPSATLIPADGGCPPVPT